MGVAGKPQKAWTMAHYEEAVRRRAAGESVSGIARDMGADYNTVYLWLTTTRRPRKRTGPYVRGQKKVCAICGKLKARTSRGPHCYTCAGQVRSAESTAALIANIERLAHELGRVPSVDDYRAAKLHPVVNAGCYSWRQAVAAAGMDPHERQQKHIREKLLPSRRGKQTHCHRGHPYSGDNLYVLPNGERVCRACHKIRHAEYRSRKQERQPSPS